MCITQSLAEGHVSASPFRLFYQPMVELDGQALAAYERAYGSDTYANYSSRSTSFACSKVPESPPPLVHQPFHDAESTFWVTVWFLVCALPQGSDNEEPTQTHKDICADMLRYDIGRMDSQTSLRGFSLQCWAEALHSRLAFLAPMLFAMSLYLFPEWAYRAGEEIDKDHAHEALRRALRAERFARRRPLYLPMDNGPYPPSPKTRNPRSRAWAPSSLARSAVALPERNGLSRTRLSLRQKLAAPSAGSAACSVARYRVRLGEK
ncbi:hypothetical protein BOTBODRAFT_446298 [Botryobasidium botryosum FD-172 SS1]|uniref:Fungal-type protein kinase domain-containing protein n=1 Tax=Botryobasidium botryosum (strain FD-172 SS1) TaxID=930990 RepID=A0A067M891_BOTB1|nr:hypothetical protein BOTBODRAFT_446298 [Botryobasidium botryosum FD-172 SS1]